MYLTTAKVFTNWPMVMTHYPVLYVMLRKGGLQQQLHGTLTTTVYHLPPMIPLMHSSIQKRINWSSITPPHKYSKPLITVWHRGRAVAGLEAPTKALGEAHILPVACKKYPAQRTHDNRRTVIY